jgi:hypothetical protein
LSSSLATDARQPNPADHQQLIEKILNRLIDTRSLSARVARGDLSPSAAQPNSVALSVNTIRDFLLENAEGLLAESGNDSLRKTFVVLSRLALSEVIAVSK